MQVTEGGGGGAVHLLSQSISILHQKGDAPLNGLQDRYFRVFAGGSAARHRHGARKHQF
jgi:hypothetical protein